MTENWASFFSNPSQFTGALAVAKDVVGRPHLRCCEGSVEDLLQAAHLRQAMPQTNSRLRDDVKQLTGFVNFCFNWKQKLILNLYMNVASVTWWIIAAYFSVTVLLSVIVKYCWDLIVISGRKFYPTEIANNRNLFPLTQLSSG